MIGFDCDSSERRPIRGRVELSDSELSANQQAAKIFKCKSEKIRISQCTEGDDGGKAMRAMAHNKKR